MLLVAFNKATAASGSLVPVVVRRYELLTTIPALFLAAYLYMKLLVNVFGNDLAVKQVDDAVRKLGVIGGVGNHYDSGAALVQLGQQFHYLFAIG